MKGRIGGLHAPRSAQNPLTYRPLNSELVDTRRLNRDAATCDLIGHPLILGVCTRCGEVIKPDEVRS